MKTMDTVPPGLQGQAHHVISGSHADYREDWLDIIKVKVYTNVFIWDEVGGQILLGLKKRGFGVNLFNGFGGKVELGESTVQAARRELKEEAGIEADLRPAGTILFQGEDTDNAHLVEVFAANSYQGTPTESEEMRPQWFALPLFHAKPTDQENVELQPFPLQSMWPDVKLWMPLMLSKKRFIGRVDYIQIQAENKDYMAKWWFGVVPE